MAEDQSEIYLRAAQVKARYGNCSNSWIERRTKDSGFPLPVYFGAQRFWRESDLIAWERDQITTPKARLNRETQASHARAAKLDA
jgi:predicted DNA-binding transcriptional regulator AlpA